MTKVDSQPRGAQPKVQPFARFLGVLLALYRRLPVSLRSPVSRLRFHWKLRPARFPRLPVCTHVGAETSSSAPRAHPRTGDVGVRVFGYLSGEFGLGESARLYATALQAAGVPVQVFDLDLQLPHVHRPHAFENDSLGTVKRIVDLVVVNPDYLALVLPMLPAGRERGDVRIGCWFWELERIPASWHWALHEFDALLASSDFIAQALRADARIPVLKVALPVWAKVASGLGRRDFGLPEDVFLFLTTFDFNSFVARKNPMAAIEAFRCAFPGSHERVALLVKSSNGERCPDALAKLIDLARTDRRIFVRDGVIEAPHLRALQMSADAFVSLHRAEGFGLGLAECMALGKPVIATGWSGNLEFMSDSTACLVDFQSVAVLEGQYPGAAGSRWADPDIQHAADCMRRLAGAPVFARELGQHAKAHVVRHFAPELVGHALSHAFRTVESSSSSKEFS